MGADVFVLVPFAGVFKSACLVDAAILIGLTGAGGGGGAFGLLVIPSSLKTATTDGFL